MTMMNSNWTRTERHEDFGRYDFVDLVDLVDEYGSCPASPPTPSSNSDFQEEYGNQPSN